MPVWDLGLNFVRVRVMHHVVLQQGVDFMSLEAGYFRRFYEVIYSHIVGILDSANPKFKYGLMHMGGKCLFTCSWKLCLKLN